MKKVQLVFLLLAFGSLFSLSSCLKKNYDSPPDLTGYDPMIPCNMTIAQLKAKMATVTTTQVIDSDWTVYGIVNADDRSGNFYKQINIEDSTGGITILIDAYSLYTKYPVGRKVYVHLKGMYFGYYAKLPQLGGIPDNTGSLSNIPATVIDNYIVRANFPNAVPNTHFTDLTQLKATNFSMLNRLVTIDNVEVATSDMGKPYAQLPSIASGTSINIEDCSGNTITLRTSGYANFQPLTVPSGKGTITAIYTTYNATPQLIIRDTSDLTFYGKRCDGSSGNTQYLLNDGFSDLSNWNAVSVTGAQVWSIAQYGNPKPCATMSGYSGGNFANEDWLITKNAIDLNGFTTISLSFETASKYSGNALECYISTNYTGTGLPSTATWTLLPATYDQSNAFTFTPSGSIDLSAYKGQKVYIAYKYTSTTSAASTWELDNVKITAQP